MKAKKIVLIWGKKSYHISSKAIEFYIKIGAERIEYLAISPDLNPIENIQNNKARAKQENG